MGDDADRKGGHVLGFFIVKSVTTQAMGNWAYVLIDPAGGKEIEVSSQDLAVLEGNYEPITRSLPGMTFDGEKVFTDYTAKTLSDLIYLKNLSLGSVVREEADAIKAFITDCKRAWGVTDRAMARHEMAVSLFESQVNLLERLFGNDFDRKAVMKKRKSA